MSAVLGWELDRRWDRESSRDRSTTFERSLERLGCPLVWSKRTIAVGRVGRAANQNRNAAGRERIVDLGERRFDRREPAGFGVDGHQAARCRACRWRSDRRRSEEGVG